MTRYYNFPTPSRDQIKFYANLGAVVFLWNAVENSMRMLLQRAVQHSKRVTALVANLGPVQLHEALAAVADDHDDEVREHMLHCARLFDALRIYRNHYVHDPTSFDGLSADAHASNIKIKNGMLSVQRSSVTKGQLDEFRIRLENQLEYQALIIARLASWRAPSLVEIQRPSMPNRLELKRLRIIERQHPPQS